MFVSYILVKVRSYVINNVRNYHLVMSLFIEQSDEGLFVMRGKPQNNLPIRDVNRFSLLALENVELLHPLIPV